MNRTIIGIVTLAITVIAIAPQAMADKSRSAIVIGRYIDSNNLKMRDFAKFSSKHLRRRNKSGARVRPQFKFDKIMDKIGSW